MTLKKDRRRLKKIKAFEKKIGYRFRNKVLLNQALTHKSYANERYKNKNMNNERLEFLGDAVLGLVISHLLYNEFPDKNEGVLTRFKSQLVSGSTLAKIATTLSIGEYVLLGKGEEASGGRNQNSNLLCATEALIGAVFLDGGLKPAQRFISRFFRDEIELVKEGKGIKDYKSTLQQVTLKKFRTIPSYRTLSEIGPDHKKHFIVEVVVSGNRLGVGSGPNKKSAEQSAAKEALSVIKTE